MLHRKSGFNPAAPEFAADIDVILLVDAVQRENMLRRIDRYTFKFHWDGPFMMVSCATSPWHNPMPWAVPPQKSQWGSTDGVHEAGSKKQAWAHCYRIPPAAATSSDLEICVRMLAS